MAASIVTTEARKEVSDKQTPDLQTFRKKGRCLEKSPTNQQSIAILNVSLYSFYESRVVAFGVRLLLHKGARLCWDNLALGLIMTVQLKGRQSVSALEFVHKLDSIQEKSSMNWLTMRKRVQDCVIPKKKQVDVLPEELLLLKHVLGHELLNNHSVNLRAPGTVCLWVPMRWNFNRYYFLFTETVSFS